MSVCCTDADDDAEGLAFNGVNGSGWAQETHPFSSPSYGRVSEGRGLPEVGQGWARAGPTVLRWTGCQWTDLERPHQLAFSPDGATLAVAPDTVVL